MYISQVTDHSGYRSVFLNLNKKWDLALSRSGEDRSLPDREKTIPEIPPSPPIGQ